MKETLVSYSFSILNQKNNGKAIFETFCQNLIGHYIDSNFIRASGTDAGGDGGIDGWSLLGENKRIKYAFSIDKSSNAKIESEIAKTRQLDYSEIRFFTNQSIKQKIKEDKAKEHPEFTIVIYDLEDLVQFVVRNPELGKFLELPFIQNSITIDYLKENNQFYKESGNIALYIPRTVNIWNKSQREFESLSLQDYCSNLPGFTIIQAPAGYGKTCCLQQIHQHILEKKANIVLPPVFIQLSSYLPTMLLETIRQGMKESGDYRCNDFLLLLDGFDEVKDTDRYSLLREISQLINDQSCIRKVLLTVRENTLNLSPFEEFFEIQTVYLKGLTGTDLDSIFHNEGISEQEKASFLGDSFFLEFSDNIFYVAKFIEYFRKRKIIAGNVVELFGFITAQEIERLFKKHKPSERDLGNLALYMTLHQKTMLSDEQVSETFGISLPMKEFHFSHKSIQEYLAARTIARQPIDVIKSIVARGSIIVPYLTNTFGFVLNILNDQTVTQDCFAGLVSWSLQGSGNARKLLQIESDKISTDMNCTIFQAVVEQEAKSGDYFNKPESLLAFGLRIEGRSRNIQYLVERIENSIDTDNFHYYTSVLQELVYRHLDALTETYQRRLFNYFVHLLEVPKIKSNGRLIASLLYSVVCFPILSTLSDDAIDFLVRQLLSLADGENIVDNLCTLLLCQNHVVSTDNYLSVLDAIFERIVMESGQMSHFVSTQTSDEQFHRPLQITYWRSFIPLTSKFLAANGGFVWELLQHVNGKMGKTLISSFSNRDLEDLFKVIYEAAKQNLSEESLGDVAIDICVDWISTDVDGFRESTLWGSLRDGIDGSLLEGIARKLLVRSGTHAFSLIIDFYLEQVVTGELEFDNFKTTYGNSEVGAFSSFFEFFCFRLSEHSLLYTHVISVIPQKLRTAIEDSRTYHTKLISRSRNGEELQKNSYQIAFDKPLLMSEIQKVHNAIEGASISHESFWSYLSGDSFSGVNQYVRFLFEEFLSSNRGSVEKDRFEKYVEAGYSDRSFLVAVVNFCCQKGIEFNDFLAEEKKEVAEWAKTVLAHYPLDDITRPLKNIHIVLSHLLRRSTFLVENEEFMSLYSDKIIGLIFSGFSRVFFGAATLRYEEFSLDYLGSYLGNKRISSFICSNFAHSFSAPSKMVSVCGYIMNHETEFMPFQKSVLKKEMIIHIGNSLRSNSFPGVIDCAFALGFSILDIDVDKLAESFVLDDRGEDLSYNIASSFIQYNTHRNTDLEVAHLSDALKRAFQNSQDEFFKKTIAEYYIRYNDRAGEVFAFYAEYLLSDDRHTVLQRFTEAGFGSPLKTADIEHLSLVNSLFQYSTSKGSESDRRSAILRIAISSYVAIAGTVGSRSELNVVLDAMKSVSEDDSVFMNRHIREIEDSFAERNYEPISAEEILRLAE